MNSGSRETSLPPISLLLCLETDETAGKRRKEPKARRDGEEKKKEEEERKEEKERERKRERKRRARALPEH